MNIIKSVDEEKFLSEVAIRFSDIYDGFQNYFNMLIKGEESEFISLIERLLDLNEGQAYFDFYYSSFSSEERIKFLSFLDDADLDTLAFFEKEDEGIYFPLTSDLIPFVVRLSTREVLFSTIYFTKYPATLWGNYDCSFPMFFDDANVQLTYINILKDFNFIVE